MYCRFVLYNQKLTSYTNKELDEFHLYFSEEDLHKLNNLSPNTHSKDRFASNSFSCRESLLYYLGEVLKLLSKEYYLYESIKEIQLVYTDKNPRYLTEEQIKQISAFFAQIVKTNVRVTSDSIFVALEGQDTLRSSTWRRLIFSLFILLMARGPLEILTTCTLEELVKYYVSRDIGIAFYLWLLFLNPRLCYLPFSCDANGPSTGGADLSQINLDAFYRFKNQFQPTDSDLSSIYPGVRAYCMYRKYYEDHNPPEID